MEFLPAWDVRTAVSFETIAGPDNGDITGQLVARLRNNDRIIDSFKMALGGTQICDANIDLGALLPGSPFKKYCLQFQFWPRNLAIRHNVMMSCWIDVTDTVEGNDASILNQKGGDTTAAEFHAMMASSSTDAPESAAFHLGLVISGDGLLKLQLQGLPAAAAWLSGHHQFKG
jgi:hypothetical protein